MSLLVKHNCRDLSKELRDVTRYPVCNSLLMNVHQAYLRDGTKLAVKKVRRGEDYNSCGGSASKSQKRLAREIYTWAQCDHRNIWPLMGLADFEGRLAVVSVWADHGNLVQYLDKTPNADRCELVLGITTGLAYLHRNGIVHGDLKGLNILISATRTPMLCDFGNSVIEGPTLLFADSRSGMGNTLRWAAPELLAGTARAPSTASDVYSLGMTILETFTGKPPYSNLSDNSVFLSVVQKKKFPARPEKEIPVESPYGNILWTLLRSCWSHNPNMRPTVRAVRYILTPMTEESLRLAPLPEPADEFEYDDGDKVDYSNQINEADEEQDRKLIKQEEWAAQSYSERFAGTNWEVDDWEVDERSVAGILSYRTGYKPANSPLTISRNSRGSWPTNGQDLIQEQSMTVQNEVQPTCTERLRDFNDFRFSFSHDRAITSLRPLATAIATGTSGPHNFQIGDHAPDAVRASSHYVGLRTTSDAHAKKDDESRNSWRKEGVTSLLSTSSIALKQRVISGPEALSELLRAGQYIGTDPLHSRLNASLVPRAPTPPPQTVISDLRSRTTVDMRDSWVGGETYTSQTHASDMRDTHTQARAPQPSQAHSAPSLFPTSPPEPDTRSVDSVRPPIPNDMEGSHSAGETQLPKRAPEPPQTPQEEAASLEKPSQLPVLKNTRSKGLKPSIVVKNPRTMPFCPDLTDKYSSTANGTDEVSQRQDVQNKAPAYPGFTRVPQDDSQTKSTGNPGPKIQKEGTQSPEAHAGGPCTRTRTPSRRHKGTEDRTTSPRTRASDHSGIDDLLIVQNSGSNSLSVSQGSYLAAGRYYPRPLQSPEDQDDTEASDDSEDQDYIPSDDSDDEDFVPLDDLVRGLARNYRVRGRISL